MTRQPTIPIVMLGTLLLAGGGAPAQAAEPSGKSPTTQPVDTGPAAAASQPTTAAELTADEILKNMRRVYAGCKSYADQGEVTQVFISAQGKRTERLPFQTWFISTKQFRFEFRSQGSPVAGAPWERYVVWVDGEHIRSYWTLNKKLDEFDSLSMALGGPTGVSGGSAVMIPALLIPEMMWGGILRRLPDAKLLGTELLGDARCYKVEGRYLPDHDPVTLWIDAKTFLVRRVFETTKIPTAEVETTIEYRPQLDGEIPKEVFEVDPSTVVPEDHLPPD